MRYAIGSILLLLVTGCAYNRHVTVYGKDGKQFVAPDLCAAIIQCKQAGEAECLYTSTTAIDAQGRTVTDSCKTVTK